MFCIIKIIRIKIFCLRFSINGILYASFKYGDGEEERLQRFFSDMKQEEVERIFLQGELFELVEGFQTEDEREDYKNKPWVNIIVRKIRK